MHALKDFRRKSIEILSESFSRKMTLQNGKRSNILSNVVNPPSVSTGHVLIQEV